MVSQLTILHSNDLHSRFDAWVRMESIAKGIVAELGRDRVVRLDAGDHCDRSVPLTEATRAQANMTLLTAAGVDGFTFGNNESLVWPVAHQTRLAESVPFSVMAADLRLKDLNLVPGLTDRAIVRRAGLKIGLFGLARDRDEFLEGLGLVHLDPVEAARECVRELRLDGCDLVICVSHLGVGLDETVAATVPGIDIIVGGHSHMALREGKQVGGTIIVQAGGHGEYLGRLDLTVEGGLVRQWRASLLATASAAPDPESQALLDRLGRESKALLDEVVAYLPSPMAHDPLGASPLAELLAQRLKVKFAADVGLTHGGVLLAGLPAGPVTLGDLLRICPCMLNPTVANLPGHALLELLAMPSESFAQPVRGNGMRGETVAGRIFGAGLESIQPDRIYRVAMNDYLAFGFEPFVPLKGAARQVHYEADLLRDSLREALTGRSFWPGDPVRVTSCDMEGRIRKYVDATVISSGPAEVVLRAGPDYCIMPGEAGGKVVEMPVAVDYHFWPGRQYNLFRMFDRSGAWVADYFNVAMPFAAQPGSLCYIDLELDVYFPADGEPTLLDEDELEAAHYRPELKARIRQVAESLLAIADTGMRPGGPIWPRPEWKDSEAD